MFYYYGSGFWILIPAMLFAFYAQSKVSSAYSRYAAVKNRKGITGAQAARRILDSNGLQDVPIRIVSGRLTDHYDPRNRSMSLSNDIYHGTSIAAVSVAAHESGHAIQHAKSYSPLKIRNAIAPVVSLVSNLAWPLAIIGLLIGFGGTASGGNFGLLLFDLGVLFYGGAVLFQAVTLPVEFNASSRAIEQLQGLGLIYEEESGSARKMLSAAAMTYVAAMAMAIANLLRLMALRGRR